MTTTTKNIFAIIVNLLIIFTLVANLASCGTILYPERKGQKPGKIDAGVAVLDGIGLLFFIIPGVIAFAVDFNNNSIYLPHSSSTKKSSSKKSSQIQSDQKLNQASIEKIIYTETGLSINLQQTDVEVIRLSSETELISKLDLYSSNSQFAVANK